ncbi:MAG: T9SS type A sorting domain-containing protein [Bacteroidota bacterium]|nr:T9SS type A sorting domain-containing protein [Bacteroidota bacterium]
MSTKTKFYTLLTGLLLLGTVSNAQVAVLEMTSGTPTNGAYSLTVPGSGFGPRSTDHVVTFVQDVANNSNFTAYSLPAPAAPSTVTATIGLRNQQYTGLTYGAATPNATPNGLMFGAGPSLSTGGAVQQATPLNSYDIMGAFNGSGGPTNNMFTSNLALAGTGIDATGDAFGNDINSGAQVFTTAQVQFDLGNPHSAATRYYYGDLVINFNRFVTNPVIHIAGLGGSYRYLPNGQVDLPANYLSTFFSTELEYQGGFPISKLSGNPFLSVAGNQILNNALAPNGGSAPAAGTFNNYGAATGSILITGVVNRIVLKVYLRGSSASQFGWSSAGIGVVQGATRAPLSGDIWFVSTSVEREQLIPLPVTGVQLKAVLNNNNDVALSWKTLTELNSRHFEIERSTDGINFTQIGTKLAAGNSVTEINYTHMDPSMSVSVYYYRLKLVDIDGRSTYSNIAMVRKAGGVKVIRMFPNPAVNQLNLEFSNAKGNYSITMYNQAGQEVSAKRAAIDFAVQYVSLERGILTAGSYIIKIRNIDTNESYVQNVIFQ